MNILKEYHLPFPKCCQEQLAVFHYATLCKYVSELSYGAG